MSSDRLSYDSNSQRGGNALAVTGGLSDTGSHLLAATFARSPAV